MRKEESGKRMEVERGGFTSGPEDGVKRRGESSQRSKAKRQRSKPRKGVEGRRWRKAGRAATESSGLAGFGLASAGMSGAEGRRSRAVRSSRPGSAQACREAWGCAMPYAGPVCRRRRSRSAGHGPAGPLPRIRAAARAGGSREPQPHACQEERSWAQG
jgi:hypothetical protein